MFVDPENTPDETPTNNKPQKAEGGVLPEKQLFHLFTSRVRIKLLSIFIPSPEEMYYVRQVTRMTREEVNAVRRELERLRDIGLLKTEQRGNRLYYKINKKFLFYYDLLRMVGKTTGLGREVIKHADSLGKVKFAMLSSQFIQGRVPQPNDIDALFVGHLEINRLQNLIREHEQKIGHEINYTVLSEDEFQFRKSRGDAFIRKVLSHPQIVLIGDEEELNS